MTIHCPKCKEELEWFCNMKGDRDTGNFHVSVELKGNYSSTTSQECSGNFIRNSMPDDLPIECPECNESLELEFDVRAGLFSSEFKLYLTDEDTGKKTSDWAKQTLWDKLTGK